MNDLAEQYSKMVECATELADFFLDQEGGTFALIVVCEMLQILLQSRELSAAYLAVEIICQVNEVEFPLGLVNDFDIESFYIEQFVDLLHEVLELQ